MKLTEEEVKSIKEQILKQIDSWETDDEKKLQAKKYIQSLNSEQLEQFLIKNKMIKSPENQTPSPQIPTQQQKMQCPFCLIIQRQIQSYQIDENKQALAVLEINPLSKGHTLIISKQHKKIEKIPPQAFTLAKKIASHIKRKLKAKEVSIQSAEFQGHSAINVIPIYEDEKLEKKHAPESELKETQEKLKVEPRKTKTITRKEIKPTKITKLKSLPQAPKRFP